jgi:site-specific recombinase XerC
MINRANWKLTKKFSGYRYQIDQISLSSQKIENVYLRYLLEWAQEITFSEGQTIRPTLPEYMFKSRLDGSDKQLSPAHIKKVLATGRRFFNWCKDNNQGFSSIKISWINTLKIRRMPEKSSIREAVSLQEILDIAKVPTDNLPDMRTKAMAVFLFLSGMRIGAFVTLPLKAVNIETNQVKQYPEFGVKTKNGKRAETILLPIPDLLKVVYEWDNYIRKLLPENGFWFSPLRADTGEIDIDALEIGNHRVSLARRNLKNWMIKENLPYHSPHKFRHGHIRWGRDHSNNISDFKAISENVMHSSMQITDAIYSSLSGSNLKKRIDNLSIDSASTNSNDYVISALEEALKKLKQQE